VIEMAQAAGLLLVPTARRDPVHATTFGVGELVAAALAARARRIVVTLGGSATVDAGAGMAQALGARLLDSDGHPIPPGGAGLLRLARIDAAALRRRMRGVAVLGATDVRSPLLGPRGTRLYTAQKGATSAQMRLLDRALAHFARIVRRDLGVDVARIPGAGAAGGLGAGLVAFLGARLVPGADTVFDLLGLDSALRRTDLVLTGEGSLDPQTAHGKLVARVAARARRFRIPVLCFAGRVTLPPRAVKALGLAGAWGLMERGMRERDSMRRAAMLLERKAAEAL
jgi:glycerate kinase